MRQRTLALFPPSVSLIFLVGLVSASADGVPKLSEVRPEDVGMDSHQLAQIDRVVDEGIKGKQMPGCVVAIGRHGKLAVLKAFGDRQVQPSRVPMTTDTVFDLASLTKPIATATSVMILLGQGKIHLGDSLARAIPEFGQNGRHEITTFQLLTHQGGLIPDNALADYADGPQKAWQKIWAMKPQVAPGSKFIYSDMGYIVLGELVRRVSGESLDQFTRDHIFQPLGMAESGFLPAEHLRRRAAPTEQRDGHWMQGEVHDPRAFALGGVAGHAGLFSTAADLTVYAQMLLQGGQYAGIRILPEEMVAEMTKPHPVSGGLRSLGWDVQTGYSSNRGRSFSPRAFGHGGFTGTVLWIDPGLDLFVIFLSNRLHPDGKGNVNALAGRIGTIAADAIVDREPPAEKSRPREDVRSEPKVRGSVSTGIDVLKRDGFRQLHGRRIGLITNHTGISREGTSTTHLLREANELRLVALFSPEHGIEGQLDISNIGDARDPSGLPIYSLYGKTRRPTAESLRDIDTLVFDIQDIGTRFYTYISTMGYAMQAAAEHKLRFVVLDRPNPINGIDVAGPMLDAGRESFTGFHRLPVRHGMTVGELALMFRAELPLELDLQIVKMEGWQRSDFFDVTGLKWVNPSPNMRSLTEAILYPGIGLLETTNLSVGRGTDTPFEVIGAPWLDGQRLVRELNKAGLGGVRFTPLVFTPTGSKFAGERCGGMRIEIVDRGLCEPVRVGLEIACQLRTLYPKDWNAQAYGNLLANREVLDAVLAGKSVLQIEELSRPALDEFLRRRTQYLLYK